jgi:hypothetical protein
MRPDHSVPRIHSPTDFVSGGLWFLSHRLLGKPGSFTLHKKSRRFNASIPRQTKDRQCQGAGREGGAGKGGGSNGTEGFEGRRGWVGSITNLWPHNTIPYHNNSVDCIVVPLISNKTIVFLGQCNIDSFDIKLRYL